MPIQNKDRFIGVFVSEETDNCLRLVSLLQGVSKSTLVREILSDKAEDNNWTEENLIMRYADVVQLQWSLQYRERQTFHSYLVTIKSELKAKSNLSEDLLEKIMKKCKDLNQNQSASK